MSYRRADLRVLVVDDEAPARSELKYLLKKTGKVNVIGDASSGSEAIKLIRTLHPEAVFLDIKMPGQDGFRVAEAVLSAEEEPPLFVFATAFDQYAFQAFEVSAVDYILKPFKEERVAQAVDRLLSVRTGFKQKELNRNLQALLKRMKEEQKPARVPVEINDRIVLMPIADICAAYCRDKEVYIKTKNEEYQVRSTLVELEGRLGNRFFRVHKGYLVNIDHVTEIIPWFHGSYLLVMGDCDKTEIPVSRRQAPILRHKLGLVL
jgi:two-component system response regulator LytT